MYKVLLEAVERGEVVQTVTLIDGPKQHQTYLGQMIMLFPDGKVEGSMLDQDFTDKVLAEIQFEKWEKPAVYSIKYNQAEYRVFWNSIAENYRVIIFGAGHISQPLAQIFSSLDYSVTVIDDRPEFANRTRFPLADEVLCDQFVKSTKNLSIDGKTVVIIVTRGHRYDLDCLKAVIGTDAGYIGMIGSRRRVKAMFELLQEEGVDKNRLQRVRAPIGLDIGAQTPAEIALSIASEVVAVLRGGSCLPLSRRGEDNNG